MRVNNKYLKNYYENDSINYQYDCNYMFGSNDDFLLQYMGFDEVIETDKLDKLIFSYNKFDDNLIIQFEETKIYFICG